MVILQHPDGDYFAGFRVDGRAQWAEHDVALIRPVLFDTPRDAQASIDDLKARGIEVRVRQVSIEGRDES